MKVSAKAMRDALAFVGPAVNPRHTLPVLSHVLLESREGGARLVTSDLDMELAANIDAIGDVCSLCIPFDKLKSCAIGDDEMQIAQAGTKVAISVGRAKHKFGFLLADSFPRITIAGPSIELPADLVVSGFKRVAHAMSVNDIRYYLIGIGIAREKNLLSMFATDGKRGMLVRHENDGPDFAAIIPHEAVLAIISMQADSIELHIAGETRMVTASKGGLCLKSKLIEDVHPDWRQVTIEPKLSFSADRSEMLNALAALRPSLGKFEFAKLSVNGVGSLSGTFGGNESVAEFEVVGDKYEAGCHVGHVANAVAECSQERVTIRHNGDAKSVIRIDDGEWTALIMPALI